MNRKLLTRRRAVTEASLKRRRVARAPAERILIACEGEKTEKRYFEAFVASMKTSGIDIEICGEECGAAPRSVVEFAAEKAREEGAPESGGYKDVFCVFDRDAHETYDEALRKVTELNNSSTFPTKIQAVTSIPCFEFWFILHFKFTRAPYQPAKGRSVGQSVVAELRKIPGFEKYQKAISPTQAENLVSRVRCAVRNARLCQEDADKTGEANPSTSVNKLIEYLFGRCESLKIEALKSI